MIAFAMITDEHDLILMQLSPAARSLYQWLLRRRPAGQSQEFDLAEFQTFSSQSRKRPYCTRQIRNALNSLIESGLVENIRQFNARFWKLSAHHPDQPIEKKTSQIGKKTSQNRKEISKKQPSKPYSSVVSYIENKETTDTRHPLHPVLNSRINKEGLAASPPHLNLENPEIEDEEKSRAAFPTNSDSQDVPISSEERKIDPQLQAEVEEVIAPQPMNQNIKRAMMSVSLDIVLDALAVVRQQKKTGQAKRPAGLLVKAIQERWTPNPVNDALETMPDGFSDWFDLAREKGIVTASLPMDGQMCVCTDPEQGDWQPWTELAFAFPLRMLKEMNPIKFRFG
ncbi:hypothetical protein C1752_17095 [Acaryochloris thomasi RCC1774]|uniref:Uncharacterized protein n=1 Tax=Acaryochloris thomasi RCC1774 TaxID=1764569 RepID=A0A2W1J6G3_9CYAN|nr:hypothetical protein [Acaryochloris thomasi]PZD70189.1 hypothetical protein C1752_17095 [Acaryochloris thomasi RCC1774]